MAIVYQHRRKDTGEIFYIGIGKDIRRAYSTDGRNTRWQEIVSESGYNVEILLEEIERGEAQGWEKYLIGIYGREDKETGILSNKTAGGEGANEGSTELGGGEERAIILNEISKLMPGGLKDYYSPTQLLSYIRRKSIGESTILP
jgi:hypothetical protein